MVSIIFETERRARYFEEIYHRSCPACLGLPKKEKAGRRVLDSEKAIREQYERF